MMTPPATCDSQPCRLMMVPQSCTATTRVQRTTPVSVSTLTSATCTPPTPLLASPWPSVLLVTSIVSMPSRAHACRHGQRWLAPRLTTCPGSMDRSPACTFSRPAMRCKNWSRAAVAALRATGAVPGQVVLPPDGLDRPNGLSPTCTVMSRGCRPRISAVMVASTVRSPVPRSCVEHCTSTEPSLPMRTLTSFGWPGPPPQVCRAMPMPLLITLPSPRPGGCHLRSHCETSRAMLISRV